MFKTFLKSKKKYSKGKNDEKINESLVACTQIGTLAGQ